MDIKLINTKTLFKDLLHLVFPEECLICSRELSLLDKHLCSFCHQELTYTNYHLSDEPTSMDQLFWGRSEIKYTHAHLQFKKNAGSQKLLFALKYKKNSSLGVFFGRQMGEKIAAQVKDQSIEAYIPVPLHPKKQFIRGYNQSEAIAQGLAESTDVAVNISLVKRTHFTTSQTGKSRFDRWDNVQSKFQVSDKIKLFKHVAIIDDVITTGSTLESIILLIKEKHPEIKISVITLAIA